MKEQGMKKNTRINKHWGKRAQVKSVWEEPLRGVDEVGVERGWWILTWGGDRGRERKRGGERGVSRWRSNLPPVDERFSSPRTSSAGDSASALQSIPSGSDGHFSLFKNLTHTLHWSDPVKGCSRYAAERCFTIRQFVSNTQNKHASLENEVFACLSC